MAKPLRVIVVEDDLEMRHLLQRYLTGEGMAVRTVADGKALDAALAREPADCLILDIMLPGEDGLAICRRLRAGGETIPIIMLTAKGDPIDRILGLEMGADDYLAKPFTPRELLARMAAIMRRVAAPPHRAPDEIIVAGPFRVNCSDMTVTRAGTMLTLSSREFQLFKALAIEHGRPLSRAQIIERALGRDADVTDRAIDTQISRLRKAIGDDPDDPQWIKTVWGVGYTFTPGPKEDE